MRTRWLFLVAALGLLLAACGGGESMDGIASLQEEAAGDGSSTTTTAEVDPEQAALEFAACMREHGVDLPDPQIGSAGGGLAFGFSVAAGGEGEGPDDAEIEKMMAADEACRYLLEGVVQQFERPDMSEMQDQMLAFSQCMRDHGIDMPDPVFSDDGGVTLIGPEAGGGPAFDPSDPAFQEAQEACQEVFGGPGAGMIMVGPGGPGGPGSGPQTVTGGGAVPAPGTDDSSGGG